MIKRLLLHVTRVISAGWCAECLLGGAWLKLCCVLWCWWWVSYCVQRVDVMHLLFRDQSVLVMELVYEKVSQQFILMPFWHGLSSSRVCSAVPYSCLLFSCSVRHKEHIRYIKTNNPISAYTLHILNNRHEYGTAEQTLELLKPYQKGSKMNCWETF
jgi:hypothetical protein